jgi:hypothetical protein
MTETDLQSPPLDAMAGFFQILSLAFSGKNEGLSLSRLSSIVGHEVSDDDLATEHFSLFGRDHFLWHSYYLSDDRMIGGDIAERYLLCYQKHEIEPNCSEDPDHLAHIFAALGIACETKNAMAIREITHHMIEFWPFIKRGVTEHANSENSVFLPLVLWIEELLKLTEEIISGAPRFERNLTQESAKDLKLDNEKTSLKDISIWFATPANCGINLTPSTLQLFSQVHNIPKGFGSRWQIIENLFTSLSSYKKLPEFMDFLDKEVEQTEQFFDNCTVKGCGASKIWQDKWLNSRHAISQLRKQTESGANDFHE